MLSTRPPIVAVLGHVDHGKTSLLDAIRHTNIQAGETGGITQHIGAYQVTHQEKLITFIDTPGHAAFSQMRARGGRLADFAILVVAADDGVMPQTKESISHITSAKIPFIVAINKVDLPDADPGKTKIGLQQEGVYVEGFGGNVPVVEVSAIKKINLDKLLDILLLMAEMEDLKADPDAFLQATVIESNQDKKGPLATVIVKSGTLKLGDKIATLPSPDQPGIQGKVRALTNWQGQSQKEALPSTPIQILGFESVPAVGALISHPQTLSQLQTESVTTAVKHDIVPGQGKKEKLKLILKTDVVGTLEAILGTLPENIEVIHAGTGPINESDILLAETAGCFVYGFRVKASPGALKLASVEEVKITTFSTIYELLDEIKLASDSATKAHTPEVELGTAKVLKIFSLPTFKVIGSLVLSGKISLHDTVKVKKADGSVKQAVITSLKQGTQDIKEAKKDTEFGVILNPQLDIQPGDIMISVKPN